MSQALLLIDLQNDYFPGGNFPLADAEAVLVRTEQAIAAARASGVHLIHIQHVPRPGSPRGLFFNEGTQGVEIHPRVLAAAPDAPVVRKHAADAFHETELDAVLRRLGVTELLLAGMMTQNCVTHTALSKAAEAYRLTVLADCCTTVSEILHKIALNALSVRVPLKNADQVLHATA